MRHQKLLSAEENIQRALDALFTALGLVETIRFLTLPRRRRLESVRRHRKWQAALDRKEFFEQVFGTREQRQKQE